jgi:hypothetical protein
MSEDTLRKVAADLNFAPAAADRVGRAAALVLDINLRIASAPLPFDSSPYAFPDWLADEDKR